MINIEINKYEDRMMAELIVTGHADYDEIGTDIVCASVSILTFTFAQIVKGLYDEGQLKEEPYIALNKGDSKVICICDSADVFCDVLKSLQMIDVGFSLLHHNYPDNVKLNTVIKA